MIDLSLYPKYNRDIQSKQTSIYPIIIINFPDNIEDGFDNSILVSTVKETFKYNEDSQTLNFKDLGLNISNIKESTDVTDRKFKISNVSISLSNYEYNGRRLSDYISDFPNSITKVYYKSQSCNLITDCLPVFTGLLRKVTYDDSKIKITLEDYTQSNFQKEVPIANLGNSENVYSKNYINKYIPITYGKVDKAPAIPYKLVGESQGDDITYYITDNVLGYNNKFVEMTSFSSDDSSPESNLMNNETDSPLYIYKDDYYNVLPELNTNIYPDSDYNTFGQYSISDDNNFLSIEKDFNLDQAQNPPANNELLCVKVQFPSGVKLLKSLDDDDTLEDDSGNSVFSLNPSTLSLEASIDSPTTQGSFISGEDYLNTFAQIPNNEPVQEDMTDDGQFLVHDFIPHIIDGSTYRRQIWYPPDFWSAHYLHFAMAWCHVNAHQMNVKFIEMPCFDLVWQRVNETILNLYNHGLQTSSANHDYAAQHQIEMRLRNAYFSQEQYDPSGEVTEYDIRNLSRGYYYDVNNHYHYESGGGEIYPDNWGNTGLPGHPHGWTWSGGGEGIGAWVSPQTSHDHILYDNARDIFKNRTFPSAVYKFRVEDYNPIEDEVQITWVLVGQKASIQTEGVPESYWIPDGTLFYNIFDDGTGTPHLFEKDECPIFDPIQLLSRPWYGTGPALHYSSYWNGVPFGNLNNAMTGNGATKLRTDLLWSYPSVGSWNHYSYQVAGYINTDNPTQGNSSLCMIFEEGIPQGELLRTGFGDEDHLGYLDEECNMSINPYTIIPCGHYQKYMSNSSEGPFMTTERYNYDYVVPEESNVVVLTSGGGEIGVADQRLTLIYDFSDISSSDHVEGLVNTFIFGKLGVDFNPVLSSIDTDSNFLIQVTAAEIGDIALNFDLDIPEFNTNLVNVHGYDNFIDNLELQWSSIIGDYDDENPLNEFSWDGSQYKIEDWSASPSSFNAMALSYRLKGTVDKFLAISTNINTIGLMQFVIFENIFTSDFYIDVFGRANSTEDTYLDDGILKFKYTDDISSVTQYKQLIENPADVLYHFIEKELGYEDIVNIESWKEARGINSSFNIAFSLSEKKKSKDLIEQIAKNTLLFPRFKQDGTFGFTNIRLEYDITDTELINSDDVIAVSVENTELKDIKTIVNVKYKKDYAEDEFIKETGYVDAYDMFGNGDLGYEGGYSYDYYGLERDSNVFEFESEFIRDRATAMSLRDFIFMQNCNQHTIIKATLPIHYTHLETGDVVKFSKVINNLKSFGEDYSISNPNEIYRNSQKIYPYFLVTAVTKSPKNVKLECIQLHKLTREFSAGLGSLSRMSQTGVIDDNPESAINPTDITIFDEYLNGKNDYFTSAQKQSADIISNGAINISDLTTLQSLSGLSDVYDDDTPNESIQLGDINQDGVINVSDVVVLIGYILGTTEITEEQIALSDYNQDGQVNVVDIVNLVSEILGT